VSTTDRLLAWLLPRWFDPRYRRRRCVGTRVDGQRCRATVV